MAIAVKEDQADCFHCKHFFITWDRDFPRGCRALGFKSRKMPDQAVQEASGIQCLKFEKKDLPPKSP